MIVHPTNPPHLAAKQDRNRSLFEELRIVAAGVAGIEVTMPIEPAEICDDWQECLADYASQEAGIVSILVGIGQLFEKLIN